MHRLLTSSTNSTAKPKLLVSNNIAKAVYISYGVIFCQNCVIFWWNMRLYQSKALPTRCNTRTLFNWFKRNPELCLIRFKTYFLSFLHSCKHVIVQWSYNCGKILILTFCSRYVPLFHRTQFDLRNTAEYALCKKGMVFMIITIIV